MKIKDFRNPPVEYRPVPFLSINDDIEEERLLEFVEELLDKGWGGLFFHARIGLVTPYMGNRWFNLVRSCVKRLKELGGFFWIYDEQGWPSGQAGGQVSKLGPELRSKLLSCRPAQRGLPVAGSLRVETIKMDGKPREYEFYVKVMPVGWLPDLLNPEAVRAFLESTHELYKIHIGREFGVVVPGVFTDEPQYATHHTLSREGALPWTDRLPEEFAKDHGYSILENLPSLFFDFGSHRKVRYHYFSTLTRLYVEAYSIQIYEWCRANRLMYTGHYEWEDSFLGQIHCIGSAMQHYEYMQQPGIDHLGRGLHNPWVEKQVSSVASQLGKKRVLSETYGVSGQSLSFHDRRWIGNWQYALGVNFLNHHVSLYSLKGVRKRDYPPTLSPHQPWWKHNRTVADYFTRLSYLLSQGRRLVDVLFISSIGSAWCEYKPSDHGGVEDIFEGFTKLTQNLLALQIDFEYGDEFIIARHARVDGKVLRVGNSSYKVVVLPPMRSLKKTTLELLRTFASSGGTVLCVEESPKMIEGEPSKELSRLTPSLLTVRNEEEALSAAIRPKISKGPLVKWVSGTPVDRLLVHRRKIGGKDLHFLVNTDYRRPMQLELDFGTRKPVLELDPLTGSILSCRSPITMEPAAGEGRVFVEGLDWPTEGRSPGIPKEPRAETPIVSEWKVLRKGPNQAVLDFARWRPGGGNWSRLVPVWKIQDEISSLRNEFEVQYEFETNRIRALDLVVEDGERFDVYVNGKRVPSKTDSWWLDPGFRRIPIGPEVVQGKNVVILKGRYDSDISIEDAYLLGEFAVRLGRRKSPLLYDEGPTCGEITDLRESGYPFYAGTVELQTEVQIDGQAGIPWIEFDELGGTVANFVINGKEVGQIFWREYRLPLGRALKRGKNLITIGLTNDLRNLLGPRHWKADEFTGVNPNSFRDYHGWTDAYVGVPFGIKGLRLVWR